MDLVSYLVHAGYSTDILNACRLVNSGAVSVNGEVSKKPLKTCKEGDKISLSATIDVHYPILVELEKWLATSCSNLSLDNEEDRKRAALFIHDFLVKKKLIDK